MPLEAHFHPESHRLRTELSFLKSRTSDVQEPADVQALQAELLRERLRSAALEEEVRNLKSALQESVFSDFETQIDAPTQ